MERHRAVDAVDEHRLAGSDARGDVPEPRDRWNAHCTGEERHVARGRPAVGGEAEDQVARQLDRLGRSQVVGDDDRRHLETAVNRRREAGKRGEEPALKVVEIAHALAEVRVVHPLELSPRLGVDALDGGLSVDVLLADATLDGAGELRVLEHHQVALEDHHVVPPGALLERGYDALEVAPRVADGAAVAEDLLLLASGLEDVLGNRHRAVAAADEDRTDREAAGSGQAL